MHRVAIVCVAVVCLSGARALAQDEVRPAVVSSFVVHADWIVASPDLKHVYLTRDVDSVNILQVAASRWIDSIVVFAAAIALVLVRRAWRAWTLRGMAGQPYCRRCRYHLKGIASAHCPECGLDVTGAGRVVGRPAGRRVACLLGLALVILGGWGLRAWLSPPQYVTWDGPQWYSDTLLAWAVRHDIAWLKRLKVRTCVIEQYEVATGRMVRRLAQDKRLTGPWAVSVSLDSRRVFINHSRRIEELDAATGRRLRTLTLPTDTWIASCWESEDGTIKATVHDDAIARWDAKTGGWLGIVQLPGNNMIVFDRPALPGYIFNDDWKNYVMVDPGGRELRRLDADQSSHTHFLPYARMSPDHRWLYSPRSNWRRWGGGSGLRSENVIEVWDLQTGSLERTLQLPYEVNWIGMSHDGKRLLVNARQGNRDGSPWLDVYDAQTDQLVRRVVFAGVAELQRYWPSSDERHALIVGDDAHHSGRRVAYVEMGNAFGPAP